MASNTLGLSPELNDYLIKTSVKDTDVQRRLREESRTLPEFECASPPEQAQLFRLLVELLGIKKVIEIGTFTGYFALTLALALPEDGTITCCDVNEEWTGIGKRYWQEAGIADKVDLRIAPAVETLDNLLAGGRGGTFDLAFIDADKGNYDSYYERCLKLVKQGGLVAIDNVLWDGKVADPSITDESTSAIRALNEKISKDDRVTACIVPIGDGLTLCRVK